MARKSKLSDKQWDAIEKRYLNGESARVLGREFKIAESAIRKRFGAQTKEIKSVANQLVAAETAFNSLPISAQIKARTLADELRAISENLASAARYGSATAHRLSGIAHEQVTKIDDAAPLAESVEALKGVAVLTKMANDASEIGLNLLRANRDAVDDINKTDMQRQSRAESKVISDDPQDASRTYLEIMGN